MQPPSTDRHGPAGLAELHDKYARIRRLRDAHVRGDETDPRDELVRLARAFPASLREIDVLPLAAIDARIEALAAVMRGDAVAEQWMVAQVLFHRLTRGALVAKRWLAGRRAIDAAITHAFVAAALGPEAEAFADDLALVARPPGGRLTSVVHGKIAAAFGITERESRRLVFGT